MSDDPILAALGRLQAGQAEIMGALGKTRADLMERMDRLQHRLDGLDEHLTMGLGHADAVERRADGVAEQNRILREQMVSMQKLLRRLEGRITTLEDRQ